MKAENYWGTQFTSEQGQIGIIASHLNFLKSKWHSLLCSGYVKLYIMLVSNDHLLSHIIMWFPRVILSHSQGGICPRCTSFVRWSGPDLNGQMHWQHSRKSHCANRNSNPNSRVSTVTRQTDVLTCAFMPNLLITVTASCFGCFQTQLDVFVFT